VREKSENKTNKQSMVQKKAAQKIGKADVTCHFTEPSFSNTRFFAGALILYMGGLTVFGKPDFQPGKADFSFKTLDFLKSGAAIPDFL